MHQEIFRIPWIDRPIYGYGLMLVIGFMLGAQLSKYLARRCGYNGDTFINASLLGLVSGVVGARLSHVLESLAANNGEFANNHKTLAENLYGMVNVSSGGLTFYGGFLLATPILIWYAIRKHVPRLRGMDIIAPSLMIGLAFGRIGCYMNGCCYGEECSAEWGVNFPYGSNAFVEQYQAGEIDDLDPVFTDPASKPMDITDLPPGHVRRVPKDFVRLPRLLSKPEVQKKIDQLKKLAIEDRPNAAIYQADISKLQKEPTAHSVYPTEIYSAFNAFFIAAVLLAFFSTRPAPGRVFALMLILKGMSRYILEMVRVEPPVLGQMSFSMVISVGLVIAGVLMWWACGTRKRDDVAGSPAIATA